MKRDIATAICGPLAFGFFMLGLAMEWGIAPKTRDTAGLITSFIMLGLWIGCWSIATFLVLRIVRMWRTA